ncbi:DUF3090 domain-containing protein [Calidifontibacter sp. DB0510]|uniref:DUF3090 domain-containing protein n=1 Tax=Metallococcus carri TaxID=1656884 RepID=A0A967E9G1_9MICO|nr:DUF3090 domain-containing protein [Metallococcus carri]NHN54829.1 DUF3090 domain-containing protein [Metallococcus carri]NOP37174.1 DUF3090 family protein [Calidifontibacter sp. DB2511S]
MPLIEYDQPDRFVVGTVGPAGQRTFFLQATAGRRVTSVSLEKAQVEVLAERINDLLDTVGVAEDQAQLEPDNAPLTTPIDDEFRVATLSLAWDPEQELVVVECLDSAVEVESDESGEDVVEIVEPDATTLRVRMSAPAAREFARRGLALVASGRPPCPFCGEPLDPAGHICPRANGYKR